jgi:hypothetical protein
MFLSSIFQVQKFDPAFCFKQLENKTPGLFYVSKNFPEAVSRKNKTPTG